MRRCALFGRQAIGEAERLFVRCRFRWPAEAEALLRGKASTAPPSASSAA
jgi:hypothetical protein